MLRGIGDNTVGWLQIKDRRFAILSAGTFNQLWGLARAAEELSGSVVLVREAAQLVLRTPTDSLAVQLLRDLTVHLGDVAGQPLDVHQQMAFDPEEQPDQADFSDVELNPVKARRALAATER